MAFRYLLQRSPYVAKRIVLPKHRQSILMMHEQFLLTFCHQVTRHNEPTKYRTTIVKESNNVAEHRRTLVGYYICLNAAQAVLGRSASKV